MRFTREHAAVAVSSPFMVAGLVSAAVADDWAVRLGGAAMVVGAATALAVTGTRARVMAWGLAALGAVAVLVTRL